MENDQYVIIGGISKAGTTSLFDYLTAHPEVGGSFTKQTYFFLDKSVQKDLNLNSVYDNEKGLDQFDLFFRNEKDCKIKVEATPDYLYANGSAERIAEFFKDRKGKIIFILRDPITRFVSYFNFGKQQGLIAQDLSFEAFYQQSKSYKEDTNPCLMAYKNGFYSTYIQKYMDCCGRGNVIFLFFEDLKHNPKELMQNLTHDLGLKTDFYDDFNFEVKNQTIQVRNHFLSQLYLKSRNWYIQNFYKSKTGRYFSGILKKSIGSIYKKINFASLKSKDLDEHTLEKLQSDFKKEKQLLVGLINKQLPW